MIAGTTRVYAVVGHPVAHSRSPGLYNRLFAQSGLDAVYVALEVSPSRAAGLADAVRTLGLAGLNLTVPHKEAILPFLDELSAEARAAGAVNVVRNDQGRLLGHNTDADGFCGALAAELGVALAGLRALVLGAGGAGRAVASGLARHGAAEVVLLNRDPERADRAARHLRAHHPATRFGAGALDASTFATHAPGADLVVNATDARAAGAVSALDASALPDRAIGSDLNYWMADPPLLSALRSRGLRVQDGSGMLAWQAALAFRFFTGLAADPVRVASWLR